MRVLGAYKAQEILQSLPTLSFQTQHRNSARSQTTKSQLFTFKQYDIVSQKLARIRTMGLRSVALAPLGHSGTWEGKGVVVHFMITEDLSGLLRKQWSLFFFDF